MRIISKPVGVETEHTCPYCGCVFAYFPSDTTICLGLTTDYKVVYCPHCERQIRLDSISHPYSDVYYQNFNDWKNTYSNTNTST